MKTEMAQQFIIRGSSENTVQHVGFKLYNYSVNRPASIDPNCTCTDSNCTSAV